MTRRLPPWQLLQVIAAGPPRGSRIEPEAWRDWHRYGWFVCAAYKRRACDDPACGMGASCKVMRAVGLAGDGSPLPRRLRPICGARNRRGEACVVRVEPGKRRCRFHGGLSTGPRTAEGKARIAEAQRRRWARSSTKRGSPSSWFLGGSGRIGPRRGELGRSSRPFGSRAMSSLAGAGHWAPTRPLDSGSGSPG
jgi:hypothetical protein